MLPGPLVRVRHGRNNRLTPCYIDPAEAEWQEVAARLLELYRLAPGRTRGELEEELLETVGDQTGQFVHRGLAKLLEDRCEFAVDAPRPPEQIREAVFRHAGALRQSRGFDREVALRSAAEELGVEPAAVEAALFADLKSEQRLTHFDDLSAERLLARYNVALAQSVILRAVRVEVVIRDETPQRLRSLLRAVKFHRLVCDVVRGSGVVQLQLDGPLSLFTATQKYGVQLASFLPHLLHCQNFELKADVHWGPQRKPKVFVLTANHGLKSDTAPGGTHVPPEVTLFAEAFRRKVNDWELSDETQVFPLGEGMWVPDFRLEHRATRKPVYLEVLGYWRRGSVEKCLRRLAEHATFPFLLAVSQQFKVDEAAFEGASVEVVQFRQMPLPDDVCRAAERVLLRAQV